MKTAKTNQPNILIRSFKLSERKQKASVAEFQKLGSRTERVKFLSESTPHVIMTISTESLSLKYRAMLGGLSIAFKDEIREFDTPEEAMQYAIKLKQQFAEEVSSSIPQNN